MDREDILRWIDGFKAAEAADRLATGDARPSPDRSMALALSLIEAAPLGLGDPQIAQVRRADDEDARRVWDVLRARL